ncbi:Polyadenylate-binding protein, cytoplasmic [Cardiosporidium cionae]|uniref:Polyadenylate-binding protein, cytoplasmic n=1 Tax=Cardiosporidium cionae TaxID=476202 RepID=A0ABQ7J8L5_9APIC|nr:Polyadenylate-binding protein, cytoplasmic [Cardiosporidium cionae]|eukprot:KAF8820333.1 Polyadenylate-binding protein, cytoplasmic [Cardiosporidium cionae]
MLLVDSRITIQHEETLLSLRCCPYACTLRRMNGTRNYPDFPNSTALAAPVEDDDRVEEIRCFVAPLSKEQLIDLVAHAAISHQDVYTKCTEAVAASPSARRLMIRNIPFSTLDEAFVALFREFGDLDDALIVREKDGRSRGYGFVTYKYLDSVRACLSGTHHLDGKELYVKLAADTYTDSSQKKLFIRNLPDCATEDSLREIFSQFGTLEECSVVKSKEGTSKGYGFLTFSTHKEAFRAVQQQERVIGQRVVFIHFAAPPTDKRREYTARSTMGRGNHQYNRGGGNRDRGREGNYIRRWGGGGGYREQPDNRAATGGVGVFGYPFPYGHNVFPNVPQGFPVPYSGNVNTNPEFYQNGPPGRYS